MKLRQTTATGLDRLERLSAQARLVLIFEKIWPLATAALCLMGLFLTLSFLGLWLEAPRWGRITGVSLFALAFAWLGFNLWRLSWPKRADELARLDRNSGVAHRPATALTDHLANEGTDPATRALWELHRKRMNRLRVICAWLHPRRVLWSAIATPCGLSHCSPLSQPHLLLGLKNMRACSPPLIGARKVLCRKAIASMPGLIRPLTPASRPSFLI